MILEIVQLVCCLLLVVVAIRGQLVESAAVAVVRLIQILGVVIGACGLVNLSHLGIEYFAVSYSGAMYEIEPPKGLALLGVICAMVLTMMPLLCVFPHAARDMKRALWISSISLVAMVGLWIFWAFWGGA